MKKVITLCLLLITAGINSFAQYNRVFYTTYKNNIVAETTCDITVAPNGGTCVLSRMAPGSTENGFTVKELDVNGNVVFNATYEFPVAECGHVTATTIIQATGGGYMVAGYGNRNNVTNPFAAYVQPNGNLLWFNVFESNSTTIALHHKVALTRAWDDGSTIAYLLVSIGDATFPIGSPPGPIPVGNRSINVIKFWAGSGLIWNKKYFDPVSIIGGAPAVTYWDPIPETITYAEDDNAHKYLIAGNARYNQGSPIYKEEGFHMAINGNGVIVPGFFSDYTSYLIPSYAFGQSAIYDASTQEFILTYTFGNNGMTPNAAVVSEMGISKIAYGSLNFNSTDVYYEDVPCFVSENYSFDIQEDATGNSYILSGFNSRSDASGLITNATLLKVDKIGTVQAFKRYNSLASSSAPAITSTVDASSNEYYVLAAHGSSVGGPGVRVISTNTLGVTCGDEDIIYGTMTYNYSPEGFTLTTRDLNLVDTFYNPNPGDSVTYLDCDPFNPQYKKPTSITATKDVALSVYPTMLTAGEQYVTIELPVDAGRGSLQLFSIDGKKIKTEQVNSGSQQTKLRWNTEISSPGIYILKVEFSDPSLNQTVRITKQ